MLNIYFKDKTFKKNYLFVTSHFKVSNALQLNSVSCHIQHRTLIKPSS